MPQQRVYVYKEFGIHLIPSYRVYPPVIVLKKNDDIVLVNLDDDDADLDIPAGVLESGKVHEHATGKHATNPKTATLQGPIVSEYEVRVNGVKAHAHSDPVIIIDG